MFNLGHKLLNAKLDRTILGFCDTLEYRLLYQTQESLAVEQLSVIKDQTNQLKAFNADLAAQVGKALEANTQALQTELPDRITDSIQTELRPILDEIKKQSTESIGGMVSDLGDQLHSNLNASLNQISDTLEGVNTSLTGLARELGDSGANVNDQIMAAVRNLSATMDQIHDNMIATSGLAAETLQEGSAKVLEAMNQTLSAIEANTKESAGALSQAASELVAAAESMGQQVRETAIAAGDELRQGIEEAGQQVTAGMSETTTAFIQEADRFAGAMDETIGRALTDLASALSALETQLKASASGVLSHAEAVEGAARATTSANDALSESSRQLVNAAEPIRISVVNMEALNGRISGALADTTSAIEASRETVDQTMEAMRIAVDKFKDVADQYDVVDEQLGKAFDTIHKEVSSAENQVRQYATEIQDQFSKGIASIQSVIDGLADFTPPTRS